jgi:hypothetical protein
MSISKPPKFPIAGPPDVAQAIETAKAALEDGLVEAAKEAADAVSDAASDAVAEAGAALKQNWDKVLGDERPDKEDALARILHLEVTMGPHKPTISTDLTVSGGLGSMSVHQGLAPYPTYELHLTACNPIDGWMGKRKLSAAGAKRTLHKHRPIVLQGHDVRLIPHMVIAPIPECDALIVKCTFLASRKCMFGAAKIVIDQTAPLGSCTLLNWPPTPMVFCADPLSLPLGDAPTSHFNTVRFHMSMLDYVMAWVEIGVDMIVDAALEAASSDKPAPEDWTDAFYDSLAPASAKGVVVNNAKNAATTGIQLAVLYAYDTADDPREPDYREVGWSLSTSVYGFETASVSGTVRKDKDGTFSHGAPQAGGKVIEAGDKIVGEQLAGALEKWGPVL